MLDDLNEVAVSAVRELGWQPTLIATAEQPVEATLAAVSAADAIVVLGGEDVDPRFYGGPASYPGSGHHEPLADEAQIEAVGVAAREGIPLLGICRGTQIINVAFGGTLVQHLPENGAHRRAAPGSLELVPTEPVLAPELAATLDPHVPVWCGHHQAIDRLGEGLVPVAIAADGVVEAVVHEGAPITGVQWHPEHGAADPSQLRALLERLDLGDHPVG
jgi:putative glutamine amidotransferase